MKRILWILPFFLLLSFSAMAQGYKINRSNVGMKGTSTLHDWAANVTRVRGNGDVKVEGGELKAVNSLSVTMDVASIKSTKGQMMDKNILSTFDASKYATIVFQMTSAKVTKQGNAYQVAAKGNLTMHGVTKPVDLSVTGTVAGDGSVQFKGTKKLKMSDFKMSAPVLFMGTLKTSDDVTVSLDVTMGK
ncbi:MAG TPA: YceI family protein [Rhodothermales bacterium]|nr:YceI family protein [Rhodothermales bacterium]